MSEHVVLKYGVGLSIICIKLLDNSSVSRKKLPFEHYQNLRTLTWNPDVLKIIGGPDYHYPIQKLFLPDSLY